MNLLTSFIFTVGRKGGHKGRMRTYTSPEEIDAQMEAEKERKTVMYIKNTLKMDQPLAQTTTNYRVYSISFILPHLNCFATASENKREFLLVLNSPFDFSFTQLKVLGCWFVKLSYHDVLRAIVALKSSLICVCRVKNCHSKPKVPMLMNIIYRSHKMS